MVWLVLCSFPPPPEEGVCHKKTSGWFDLYSVHSMIKKTSGWFDLYSVHSPPPPTRGGSVPQEDLWMVWLVLCSFHDKEDLWMVWLVLCSFPPPPPPEEGVCHKKTSGWFDLYSVHSMIKKTSGWFDLYSVHSPPPTRGGSVPQEDLWMVWLVLCSFHDKEDLWMVWLVLCSFHDKEDLWMVWLVLCSFHETKGKNVVQAHFFITIWHMARPCSKHSAYIFECVQQLFISVSCHY